ncbi:hypothetical protein Bca4012_028514 [Brassica carinata]
MPIITIYQSSSSFCTTPLGPKEGDVGRNPSLRTASSPPPRPPLENHPPVHQITPQVFHSTPSSPRPPTSRMRLNRRESIDTSRSHPPTFNTNTKKRASRKHQLLPPESFNRPPTRSQPPQPKQDRITKNQPRKRNQTLKWSLGTKSRQRWNCRSLHVPEA